MFFTQSVRIFPDRLRARPNEAPEWYKGARHTPRLAAHPLDGLPGFLNQGVYRETAIGVARGAERNLGADLILTLNDLALG